MEGVLSGEQILKGEEEDGRKGDWRGSKFCLYRLKSLPKVTLAGFGWGCKGWCSTESTRDGVARRLWELEPFPLWYWLAPGLGPGLWCMHYPRQCPWDEVKAKVRSPTEQLPSLTSVELALRREALTRMD
jgi:hypothetical protein